jgi:tetratricopeptide (TPR) repeat protein
VTRRARVLAVVAVAALAAASAALALRCFPRDAKPKLPPPPPGEAVKAAAADIEALEFPSGRGEGEAAELVDVGEMDAAEFRRRLESFPGRCVRLWMPGERHWLLVGRRDEKLPLAKSLERFAADAGLGSLVGAFASYVGSREEVMPAFEEKLEGKVLPQWFVTREVPRLDWIDFADIDDDIAAETRAEIRSMQVVRRLVLEGNIAAAKADDEKALDDAVDCWVRAAKRNPRDPMLLDRLDRLSRNGETFFRLGKFQQAMKCYETVIAVRPRDEEAIANFAACLRRIGRSDLADKVLEKTKAK